MYTYSLSVKLFLCEAINADNGFGDSRSTFQFTHKYTECLVILRITCPGKSLWLRDNRRSFQFENLKTHFLYLRVSLQLRN